jgi:3-methyladenine DNA glycosylase AlkD
MQTPSTLLLAKLKALSDPRAVEGMAQFGISSANAYGISVPVLRSLAKEVGKDHALAQELWASGIHEARILAAMVDDPALVDAAQMERWVMDFDSWDVCDGCCGELFDKTEFAYRKAVEWTRREEEFVRRAGYVLMAELAVHDKEAGNAEFEKFLSVIEASPDDTRNFVKRAVSWALRQIGKRDSRLNRKAIAVAKRLQRRTDSRSARWIASDALRELTSAPVQRRLALRRAR